MCDDGEADVNWCFESKRDERFSNDCFENENVDVDEMLNVNNINVKLDERNFIKVLINDKYISALVDSGADQCTVSRGMIEHLFTNDTIPKVFKSPFLHVLLADGKKKIKVLGKVFMEIDIQGENFRVGFHIKDTECKSIILGNNFLKQQAAILKFASSIIQIKPMSKIFAMENVILSPFCVLRVEAKVDGLLPDGIEGMVEPTANTFVEKNNLELVYTLSKIWKGKTSVLILNNQESEIRIRKGSYLGKFLALGDNCDVKEFQIQQEHAEKIISPTFDQKGKPFLENFIWNNDHLDVKQGELVKALVNEFADIFFEYKGVMGHYVGDTIAIDMDENAKPVKKSPYRVHPKYSQKLDEEINMLLAQGVVEESFGDWSSPALVVPKPGRPDEIRLVVDFRAVNKLVTKDAHPLPRMDDAFVNVSLQETPLFLQFRPSVWLLPNRSRTRLQKVHGVLHAPSFSSIYPCSTRFMYKWTEVPKVYEQSFQWVYKSICCCVFG